MKYPIGSPSITEAEIANVVQTLRDGRLTQGWNVCRLEALLETFFKVKHVVCCSSGTAALHLALVAVGIGPGDEVLVPDLTYVATANAVAYTGATPVLVDVNPQTWNICLKDAAQKVTARTKAILPVHLYGVPCDMDAMSRFADVHDVVIVEDAAEALGGHWQGLPCGTMGLCGTFSFYGNKVITTCEGGAIATNDDALADTLRFFRGQAVSPIRRFWHSEVGFNYRMTDVHAAIGIAQMGRIQELLAERNRVVELYQGLLLNELEFPFEEGSAPWLFTAILPSSTTFSRVERTLENAGIEVRPVFVPMHRLPMYATNLHDEDFPNACRIERYGISLPTYPSLTDDDVIFIAEKVSEACHA